MSKVVIVQIDKHGQYNLSFSESNIVSVDVSDVDLVITASDGTKYILPNAAYNAMDENPPNLSFSDKVVSADKILNEIGLVDNFSTNQIYKTFEESEHPSKTDIEKLEKQLQEAKEQLEEQEDVQAEIQDLNSQITEQQNQINQQQKELAEAKEKVEASGDAKIAEEHNATIHAPESNQEASVSKYTEEIKRIIENTSTKDYDYSPPSEFALPPHPPAGPPGVPPPLSMTPLVSLSMGNVVGTNTSVSGATTTLLGGGGAVGSEALSDIGPRDAQQFSSATITGTAGNDVIRAQGPLVGNPNPDVNTDHYAKQFVLSVAGYFSSLNDVVFSGIPSYVSITHATKQADGTWVLPSANVLSRQTFEIVYDKDSWRSEPVNYFDMKIKISGEMQNAQFNSDDTFRFQFVDVVDSSQVTDPTLTTWLDSQTKQIYILPTLDQPNIINHGEGNDFVYGGQSHDTITGGNGNNEIRAYEGNNIINEGNGDNKVYTLNGNDTITVGDGSNLIDVSGGTNTITVGNGDGNTLNIADGTNTITVGNGTNNHINTGGGSDHIILHDLAGTTNFITDTGGNNVISVDVGNNTIVTGSGNNQITVTGGSGTNTINSGDGNNSIYLRGTGSSSVTVGDGVNNIYSGFGTNNFTVGTGTNVVNYSLSAEALTIDMQSGSAIDNVSGGTNIHDTFSGIYSVVGSNNGDTIVGNNAGTTIHGGSSVNTITGGTGVDHIYAGNAGDTIDGGGGLDFLYGGTGNDTFINPIAGISYDGHYGGALSSGEINTIDYSAETTSMDINLLGGIGVGGRAQGSTYVDINHIISGSGNDALTAANIDTILEGGSGTNTLIGGTGNDKLIGGNGTDYLTGGMGDNILIGNSGANRFNLGSGNDQIIATTSGYDYLIYEHSKGGVVVNLDQADHSFVDLSGATRTVSALSGASFTSSTDQLSYAVGDTYSDDSGTASDIERVYGSDYQDLIIGNSSNTSEQAYYGRGGHDTIIGSSNTGIDYFYMDWGGNKIDGLNGTTDIFYLHGGHGITAYLDGSADVNGNGIADNIDRGVTIASGYTGFASNWGDTTYMRNIDNMLGGSGNDTMVGDNNDNQMNARSGLNLVYALGGDDLITATEGNDIIDGGSGNDTISFLREGILYNYEVNTSEGVDVFLSDSTTLNGHNSNLWGNGAQTHTVHGGIDLYNTLTSIENIHGSHYGDYLAGDSGVNIIEGNNGDDWITGNGGADVFKGGSGNDTIFVKASDVGSVSSADAGSGTDTLMLSPNSDGAAHFTFSQNYFAPLSYTNFEIVDVRDQSNLSMVTSNNYSMNANDVQKIVNNGTSSTLSLRLDTGDIFTASVGAGSGALSFLNTIHTATDDQYKYYSDVGNTHLVATLNVHYGIV